MSTASPALRDRLPEFAKNPPPQVIVKDYRYIHTPQNEIDWNNKHRITGKLYSQFHKFADEAAPKLQRMQEQEAHDKEAQEFSRILRLSQMRHETNTRMRARKQERRLLQTRSQQSLSSVDELPNLQDFSWLNTPVDRVLGQRLKSAKHSVRIDNKWNFLLEIDQKHITQLLVPYSVKGEENMLEHIQKKLAEEKNFKQLEKQAFKEKHDEIRSLFLRHHEKNSELEKRSKLVPEEKRLGKDGNESETIEMQVQPSIATRPQTAQLKRSKSTAAGRKIEVNVNDATNRSVQNITLGKATEPEEALGPKPIKTENSLMSDVTVMRNTVGDEVRQATNIRKTEPLEKGVYATSKIFKSKLGFLSTKPANDLAIKKLAEPKSKEYSPRDKYNRTEYKGLWVKELAPKALDDSNPFARTLTAKSSIYSRIIETSKQSRSASIQTGMGFNRPTTSGSKAITMSQFSRPGTANFGGQQSSIVQRTEPIQTKDAASELEDKKYIETEMAKFEAKYCQTKRPVGYPSTALEQAKMLTDGKNFRQALLAQVGSKPY